MNVTLVVEDDVHMHAIRKIISANAPDICITRVLGKCGNVYIKNNIRAFNEAARFIQYIILTDLDDIECPPTFIENWIPFKKSPSLLFSIAVREAESWLLADRKSFADFFGISKARITKDPESINDIKQYIVSLVQHSKKRTIREGLLPKGTARVGILYNALLEQYIVSSWNTYEAAISSKSLNRFIEKIKCL